MPNFRNAQLNPNEYRNSYCHRNEFRCIQCGFRIKRLFLQYSPGNIRLMKCENCKAVADDYIECEIMILLIDLILHKPKAYRHLVCNLVNQENMNMEAVWWKSLISFLFLDVYRLLLLSRTEEEWDLAMSFSSAICKSGKILVDVVMGNFMFLCILLLATRTFLKSSGVVSRYQDILLAIVISSYFKIFLIALLVWEFPSSVVVIIDIFILSSNAVALRVITESALDRCVGACFVAHAVKLFVSSLLRQLWPF